MTPSLSSLLRRAYRQFAVVNPARHGAALAYYGMFSLIPILTIGYLLVYRVLSEQALSVLAEFRSQISLMLGEALVVAFRNNRQTALRLGRIMLVAHRPARSHTPLGGLRAIEVLA
jgi:uncharacterized BrkB/YihY/UPF0761 family membrane protein